MSISTTIISLKQYLCKGVGQTFSPFFFFMCEKELWDLLPLEVNLVVIVTFDGVFFANCIILLCEVLLEGQQWRLSRKVWFISEEEKKRWLFQVFLLSMSVTDKLQQLIELAWTTKSHTIKIKRISLPIGPSRHRKLLMRWHTSAHIMCCSMTPPRVMTRPTVTPHGHMARATTPPSSILHIILLVIVIPETKSNL